MSAEIKQAIAVYLTAHKYLSLATVGEDGNPVINSMGFGSVGTTVYMATFKGTRKVENIERNPQVALALTEEYDEMGEIQGVEIQGRAVILQDKADIGLAAGCLVEKFPQFAEMGPNPDVVFLRVDPSEAVFLDYSVEFGHKDVIRF